MRCVLIPIIAGATLLAPAAPAAAQSLASRVAAAPANAAVRFQFQPKPGVCGDGEHISVRSERAGDGMTVIQHDDGSRWTTTNGRIRSDGSVRECREGPVVVELERSGGGIERATVRVGGTGAGDMVDLGTVDAAAATAFLLDERTLEGADGTSERLIFAATLAPVEIWPSLLTIARSRSIPTKARTSAIFWLSNAAGDKATDGMVSIVGDDSDEIEIRKQAVFAISRMEGERSVTELIRIARTNREPEIRRNAMFWLSRKDDTRVVEFFEEILRG